MKLLIWRGKQTSTAVCFLRRFPGFILRDQRALLPERFCLWCHQNSARPHRRGARDQVCGLKDTGTISPSAGCGPAVHFTKPGSASTQGKGVGTKGNVSPSTRTPQAPGPRPCVSTHCFSVTDRGYRGIMSTVLEGEEVMKGSHLNAGEPLSSEHPTCYRLTRASKWAGALLVLFKKGVKSISWHSSGPAYEDPTHSLKRARCKYYASYMYMNIYSHN